MLTKDAEDRRRKCTRCGHRYTTVEVLKDEQKRLRGIEQGAKELAARLKAVA